MDVLVVRLLAGWLDNLNPVKWVQYLLKGVYRGIRRFVCWFFDLVFGWLEDVLSLFLGYIPDLPGGLGPVWSFFNVVNHWFPLDELLWCAFTYYSFCAVIASIRFIKSWIPTLGG